MEVELKLNIGSYSVNNAYYKRNKQYNQNARKYRRKFIKELNSQENISELNKLRKAFKKERHYLSVSFFFHYSKDILFTQDNYLSRRAKDLDNVLKLPIDFLCNPKYMVENKYLEEMGMSKIVNLGIDDQLIGELHAHKRLSLDGKEYVLIRVKICDLSKIHLIHEDF